MCSSCGNYEHGGDVDDQKIPDGLGKSPSENMTPENKMDSLLQHYEAKLDNLHDMWMKKQGDNGTFPEFEARIKELEGKAKDVQGLAEGGMVESSTSTAAPDVYAPPAEDDAQKHKIPGYDMGGDPSDDLGDFSVGTGDSSTVKKDLPEAPKPAPSLAMPASANNYSLLKDNADNPPVMPPSLTPTVPPMAAKPAISPAATPASSPQPAPAGTPEGGTTGRSNPMTDFFASQKDANAQFSPQAEAAAQRALLNQQNSFGHNVAEGVAGFGDSLVSLAGGKGNALDTIKNRDIRNQQGLVDKTGQLRTAQQGASAFSSEMMDKDPSSVSSKAAQNAAEKIGGLPPGSLKNVSASQIKEYIGPAATASEAKARIQEMAEMGKMNIAANMFGKKLGAAQDVANTPLSQRLANFFESSSPEAKAKDVEANMAGVSGGSTDNGMHQQALAWAKANPTDPRAAAVLQKAQQNLGR
jgi:hypothetical protein